VTTDDGDASREEAFARVRAEMAGFRPRDTPAIRAAREYGLDIGLLRESLLRTPLERVQRNDEILATLALALPR
jgi:hypothetical protein